MARSAHRSQTALSEAAGGERLPTWDTTESYIRACGADPGDWRERWERVARLVSDVPSSATTSSGDPTLANEPTSATVPSSASASLSPLASSSSSVSASAPVSADGAAPSPAGRRVSRFGLAAAGAALVAATVGITLAVTRPDTALVAAGAADVAPSAGSSDNQALLTAAPSAVDGADPKDSGCSLDPGVSTLDSAEITFRGLPAGLVQLRYSPMCGVAWPRFEPFPQADIPTGVLIHVDVVRPDDNDLRLPFSARYTGAPVFGNVMLSTSRCVYAAAFIEVGGSALPESRTHCFRGRTAELTAGQ